MDIDLGIDPGRLLFGLSRIGYTTSSALCDIIDNSIRAEAKNVTIVIRKEKEEYSDTKKNNVREYLIIDNGLGMDEQQIQDALQLGSSDVDYEINSLSKFGLGLKSASFSQGDTLRIISSADGVTYFKYEVSLPKVIEAKRYFATKLDLNEDDRKTIDEYLSDSSGTIIAIGDIRKNNHPSVRNTIKELHTKAGVIYFYYIKDSGVSINIGQTAIKAIDPLFIDEANENGNLNENEWDGTVVQWIEKPQELTLDDESGIKAIIEITQLPYPPIFKIKSPNEGKDAAIREKYLIGAGNYGFYVYRNKRLISWASQLQGIIPYDQDYFAFRGRILINDTADDFFNIDVKKSSLTLSEEAWNTISDFSKEAKSKSKAAWLNAGKVVHDIINKNPNELANKLVDDFEQIDRLPGDQNLNEDELNNRLKSIKEDMEEKVIEFAKMLNDDLGGNIDVANLPDTPESKEKAIKGENNPSLSKIFRVSSVIDNLLWEPYYDTDLGPCVRINRHHRFARLIYENNSPNKDLQIIFDILLLQLAESELYAYKNIADESYEKLKSILTEYRRIVSEFLANLTRKLEDRLPPNYSSDSNI